MTVELKDTEMMDIMKKGAHLRMLLLIGVVLI